jgi:DNA-binding Lrp family transcriptional regulator
VKVKLSWSCQFLESILINKPPRTINKSPEKVQSKAKRCAFVFITAESNSCEAAFEALRDMDAVEEVYRARGAYDIIAKVNGDSVEHLREDVLQQIKRLSSIKSTLTLTII